MNIKINYSGSVDMYLNATDLNAIIENGGGIEQYVLKKWRYRHSVCEDDSPDLNSVDYTGGADKMNRALAASSRGHSAEARMTLLRRVDRELRKGFLANTTYQELVLSDEIRASLGRVYRAFTGNQVSGRRGYIMLQRGVAVSATPTQAISSRYGSIRHGADFHVPHHMGMILSEYEGSRLFKMTEGGDDLLVLSFTPSCCEKGVYVVHVLPPDLDLDSIFPNAERIFAAMLEAAHKEIAPVMEAAPAEVDSIFRHFEIVDSDEVVVLPVLSHLVDNIDSRLYSKMKYSEPGAPLYFLSDSNTDGSGDEMLVMVTMPLDEGAS